MLPVQEGAPKNPRAVAEALIANLPSSSLVEGTPTIAGAGFVNIRISPAWMGERLKQLLTQVRPAFVGPHPWKLV
jgi:arginyl-tRNA synthetase